MLKVSATQKQELTMVAMLFCQIKKKLYIFVEDLTNIIPAEMVIKTDGHQVLAKAHMTLWVRKAKNEVNLCATLQKVASGENGIERNTVQQSCIWYQN